MRFVTCLAVFFLLLSSGGFAQNVMRVHFINVGQGAATLIEFPRAAIMVDAGGEVNTEFDFRVGLMDYLETFFANRPDLENRLNALIITHSHNDHARGAPAIRQRYTPRNIVINGRTTGGGADEQEDLRTYALDTQNDPDPDNDVGLEIAELEEIPPGMPLTNAIIDPVNGTAGVDPEIHLLWGRLSQQGQGWSQSVLNNQNNHSLVVRIDFGEASLLITGDLEHAVIDDLIEHYAGTDWLDVDVYQVGHHGSTNATTPSMLHAMTPEWAVISMGSAERRGSMTAWDHGHPNLGIVNQLEVAISGSRTPRDVEIFDGQETDPITRTIDRAIYATGWDGTVVLEADAQGNWSLAQSADHDHININTATLAQLVTLPRIGPVRAQAIIDHRIVHGNFGSIDDITDVHGIGPGILESIRSQITVH